MKPGLNVLLLGANSFGASALAKRLSDSGCHVQALSHSGTVREPIEGVDYHFGSLGEQALLRTLLADCDTVFHFASGTTPGLSARRPTLEANFNMVPTASFIELAQDFPHLHIVYVSTGGAIYGDAHLARETDTLEPRSYYGAGKVAVEHLFRVLHSSTGNRLTILRPSNFFGPGQPLKKGFGLIRSLLECARTTTPATIWGDGSSVRDYIYIDDFVESCISILVAEIQIGASNCYNVGSGVGYSTLEVCDIIERVTQTPLQRVFRDARRTDVHRIVLDCSSIGRDTGWKPRVSLEDGIARMWRWLTSNSEPPASAR